MERSTVLRQRLDLLHCNGNYDFKRTSVMRSIAILLFTLGAGLAVGCSDRPHDYGSQRPPVDQIDSRDSGLQSKDVVAASDKMAQDLLADHDLNASRDRWTMVVGNVQNETSDPRANLNIFLARLKDNLAELGHDRVALIENKAAYHKMQSQELEGERQGDTFGQGDTPAGVAKPTYRGIQPDYELNATMMDLPNRGTDYYYCEFKVDDLRTRETVWARHYEVKVARD